MHRQTDAVDRSAHGSQGKELQEGEAQRNLRKTHKAGQSRHCKALLLLHQEELPIPTFPSLLPLASIMAGV